MKGYTLKRWFDLVRTKGALDFKKDQQQQWGWKDVAGHSLILAGVPVRGDVLGNLYYGYAGRKAGFPGWLLQAGAGFYNGYEYARRPIKDWRDLSWVQRVKRLFEEWPRTWWRTWFDDPTDNAAIRAGIELYNHYTARGQTVDEKVLGEMLQKYGLQIQPEGAQP